MFTHHFKQDYEAIEAALKQGKVFALSRFGDGEWAILKKKRYRSADAWSSKGETWIRAALLESLQADLPGYCVGYSPPCCHPKCVGFYADNMRVAPAFRTYATVFFHGNFPRAKQFFSKLDSVTVGSSPHSNIRVSGDVVTEAFDTDAVLRQMLEVRDKPILLAAGPAACVLIHRYWRWTMKNPQDRVACIDIGALLDESTHGKRTRYYHDPSSGLHEHFCNFTDWSAAKQRQVVPVHNATRGRFDRFTSAPNTMKSPLQQVAERRAKRAPKWVDQKLKGKK